MYRFSVFSFCLLLLGCQKTNLKSEQQDSPPQRNMAEQFVDAYNQHDVAGMLQWVHVDIRYMYVSNDRIYTETSGKAALQNFLNPFFANKPHAKSELLSSEQSGPFIHQVERALWQDSAGNNQSQCSLSVYQIREQLIANIWYFDVFQCPVD